MQAAGRLITIPFLVLLTLKAMPIPTVIKSLWASCVRNFKFLRHFVPKRLHSDLSKRRDHNRLGQIAKSPMSATGVIPKKNCPRDIAAHRAIHVGMRCKCRLSKSNQIKSNQIVYFVWQQLCWIDKNKIQ